MCICIFNIHPKLAIATFFRSFKNIKQKINSSDYKENEDSLNILRNLNYIIAENK